MHEIDLVLLEDDPAPEILQKENQLSESVAEPARRADLRVIAGIIAARQFSEEIIRQYFKLEPPNVTRKHDLFRTS